MTRPQVVWPKLKIVVEQCSEIALLFEQEQEFETSDAFDPSVQGRCRSRCPEKENHRIVNFEWCMSCHFCRLPLALRSHPDPRAIAYLSAHLYQMGATTLGLNGLLAGRGATATSAGDADSAASAGMPGTAWA